MQQSPAELPRRLDDMSGTPAAALLVTRRPFIPVAKASTLMADVRAMAERKINVNVAGII
jgi:hypothetical protein